MTASAEKPQLVVHIGLGKTGSTVLQKFFSSNRESLEKHGIIYPAYGEKDSAHHLLSPYLPADLQEKWSLVPATTWAPELARTHAGVTLLSSELIGSSDVEASVVREFCAAICASFDLKIAVYLRRPDNIIMANYSQQVKTGKQRLKLTDIYQHRLPKFNYEQILQPWADSIGSHNIIVRPYERQQFHLHDIRLDFLYHIFGISDSSGFTLDNNDPNPRLHVKVLEFKRLLNNVVHDPDKALLIQRLISQHGGDMAAELSLGPDAQALLPTATRLEIISTYAEQNSNIARNYLGRDDGQLFYEPLPDPDENWEQSLLSAEETASMAAYLAEHNARLMLSLAREVPKFIDSPRPVRRSSALLLADALNIDSHSTGKQIKKLIIHAGTHKTGSTAIQSYLATQRNHPEFDFISGREANSSLLMMQAFRENLAQLPHFEHENLSDKDVAHMRHAAREKLEKLCRATTKPISILSAEEISTFTVPELEEIYDFLAPLFDEIEIFLYVRPLKARMESTYQEVLKTRYRSLEQQFPLNYMGLARNFDSVFWRENVHFFQFSRATFPRGNLVAHFLEAAGVSGDIIDSSPDNLRLSREAVQLLYAYRLHFPHMLRGDNARLRKLATLGDTPFHFHSSLFHKLLHTGKNASSRFAERAGFSVEEDIGSHDQIGIREEADLLNFPRESLKWLGGQLSLPARLKYARSSRPEKVAIAVRSLT